MRDIRSTKRAVERYLAPVVSLEAGEGELRNWLVQQAFVSPLWLLAHTLTGVVWGKVEQSEGADQKTLITSYDVFGKQTPGRLLPRDIQMCRLFGPTGELLLWPDDDALRSRRYRENGTDGEDVRYFDEEQILWGTQVEANDRGFMLVSDGVQGLRHAVPYVEPDAFDRADATNKQRPLRLMVRHYLAQAEDGSVTIAGSRLVRLITRRVNLG